MPSSSDTPAITVGCSWFKQYDFVANPKRNNFAYPETNAVYWYAAGPAIPQPGDRIKIVGNYPDARYFSIHAYDGLGFLLPRGSVLADYQFVPNRGSSNPFLSPTRIDRSIGFGGRYTAYVEYTFRPAIPSPNTIYRGPFISHHWPYNTLLAYRSYLPPDPSKPEGDFGLPKLYLVRAGLPDQPFAMPGDRSNPDFPACNLLWHINLASPFVLPPNVTESHWTEPKLTVFSSAVGGLFSNKNNAYVAGETWKAHGPVVLLRGHAPAFTGQSPQQADAKTQLRFWSICQNEAVSTKVVQCIADRDATLTNGFYHVVISDSADRPLHATTDNGFNWMPRGIHDPAKPSEDPGDLVVRNLLPSTQKGFPQAIQYISDPLNPISTMGDYDPQATYCDAATFDRAYAANPGATPDDVFAACQSMPPADAGIDSFAVERTH